MLLTSTVAAELPTVTVCAEIVPTAVGARLGCGLTVTEMVCFTLVLFLPVAVTVIVAVPAATGVMVTVDPGTPTVGPTVVVMVIVAIPSVFRGTVPVVAPAMLTVATPLSDEDAE